ncbi:hypothetical protein F2P81_022550 [Scophthalmus maximus]|uniref:Uncharacterized protein n=1 Tax=Scophthalmus maximus TaxID=52904 RepID=A0A6A4RZF3_SCOMX|nr:hypothetical protein F2P81_022550 [Scophthalmus maximus]
MGGGIAAGARPADSQPAEAAAGKEGKCRRRRRGPFQDQSPFRLKEKRKKKAPDDESASLLTETRYIIDK